MHFNGLTHAYSMSFDWRQALLVDCLFYWAVPVFFMLSGATLLGYLGKYDTKTFFTKRARRVLVPFLAWSVIALIWKVLTGQMEPPVGPRSLINLIFNTQIIDIYWFFIPLAMVYLSMPVLSSLRDRRKVLWYLAVMGATINILLPFVAKVVGLTWNSQAAFPIMGGYLTYVVLGYLLKDASLSKSYRILIYVMGIAGVLVRYVHTVVASDASGALVESTWGYTNAPCFVESIAVFVFAKQVDWQRLFRSESSQRALSVVAGCSFGIYLIHMILFWYGLHWTGLNGGDIEWRLFGPPVAYVICLALVWLGKRVPVVKELLP